MASCCNSGFEGLVVMDVSNVVEAVSQEWLVVVCRAGFCARMKDEDVVLINGEDDDSVADWKKYQMGGKFGEIGIQPLCRSLDIM